MAKRLAALFTSVFRWMVRQALTSLVVVVGAVVGWTVRKSTGPALISEQVALRPAGPAGHRPAAVGTADPAARGWLEEASRLAHPSASLLELRRALDAGEIGDFGRLARAMLTHPLPLFRREALIALLPAWGEKDPAAAVRFAAEYEADLFEATGDHEKLSKIVHGLSRAWARRDPEAALRSVPPDADVHQRSWVRGVWEGLAEPGAEGTPSLVDRLKLVTSIRGEAAAEELVAGLDFESWERSKRAPAADDWRTLAGQATSPGLKSRYLMHALARWRDQQAAGSGAAEARAWIGQALPPDVEAFVVHMGTAADKAGFLRSGAADQLARGTKDGLFGRLMSEDLAQARAVFEDEGAAAWVAPRTLGRGLQGKSDSEVRAWLGLIPDPDQRQEVLREVILPLADTRSLQALTSTLNRAMEFGADGDSVLVAALSDRSRARLFTQQVPDIFGSLPPEVQARTRLEVVLGLGERAPDVAAELWMDATPEELAQPGAAVVAEEVAARLVRRDPETGSAWIRQLPPGESRDRAVARMIEATAANDPATCTEWAATLTDPASRSRAAEALAKARTSPSSP